MKSRFVASVVVLGFMLLSAASFAVPVRGSSQNGVDSDAASWNLFGPTAPVTNDDITVRTQVVCTNQQVSAAIDNTDFEHAGSCVDGAYTFLFQVQSKSKNVTAVLDDIVGFTANANSPASYGVEICDSDMNTLELCTNATADQLPNIKTTISTSSKKTKIKFVIPKFPTFPAGTARQGQGITLVVTTQQTDPLPISYPQLTVKK